MKYEEKTLTSELVYDGRIIKVYRDRVKLPNGAESFREMVRHRGAVAAVPITGDGKVYLVKQFRYAVGRELLEIPAGKLDTEDEDPEWRMIEELEEEIGMRPGRLESLGYVYTSPGFTSERINLYLAFDLTPSRKSRDEDEFLDVVVEDLDEVVKMCIKGEIVDAKTVVAIFRAIERLKGGV